MMGAGNSYFLVATFVIVASLCWNSPPYAYGQLTDPVEVEALWAVRSKLKDPLKRLNNWRKKQDPCASNFTGVICFFNQTDGYLRVQELRFLRFNLSGTLAPELGLLTHMKTLNFLWNNISGSIPKEIGNITALVWLLLSGNQISGPLPDELGYLPNLDKFQLDLNYISGPIPKSFANLPKVVHFHMNNNLFSGQIPPELATLPRLKHVLLDNNNLTGYLPPELSQMPSLTILQLDNNNFQGTAIPDSYSTMPKLVKLSLRNCSLQGTIPDLSGIRSLFYLDLSKNQLTGNIPSNRLSQNVTTIILSDNNLNGSIPSNFSGLPRIQKLYLNNNSLSGSVPSNIWGNITFTSNRTLAVNFEDNLLSDVSGILNVPPNVTFRLGGNPVCRNTNQQSTISQFCGAADSGRDVQNTDSLSEPVLNCLPQSCPTRNNFEFVPTLPSNACFCAAPFGVGLRLRSPSISNFPPYLYLFEDFITSNVFVRPNVSLYHYQVYVDSIQWETGPRLRMLLQFYPQYANDSNTFNESEVQAIASAFAHFSLPGNDTFGPYDLLNFTPGYYADVLLPPLHSGGGGGGMSKGAVAGVVLGSISCALIIILVTTFLFRTMRQKAHGQAVMKDQSFPRVGMKVDGVKAFSFEDLQTATGSFSISTQIGEGGYGKVFKGTLGDGTVVAIKRAQQGSLQGEKEFFTEIEMLSRLHHRNLVSLVGFCDEKDEQMLVYEFMPNGSLHDLLSGRYRRAAALSLGTRLHIALGAARGILYLHTEADPPIIHRDIKANNILLDSKWTAKVSDFGISRLAPTVSTDYYDAKGGGPVTAPHISTNVKGTPGYVDPEYFLTQKLTEKSDVYSLGIVFLELLTGMQPISHGRNIVREVTAACQSGMMSSIIDRNMGGSYPSDCVKKFMALALRCSMDDTKDRPSMLEVVRELENISSVLPPPESPASANINVGNFRTPSSSSSPPSSSSLIYYDNNNNRRSTSPYVSSSMDLLSGGSDLVSGVIPTIKPR